MSAFVRRSLAAVAAVCTLGLLVLAFVRCASSPGAPKPVALRVQAQNVIVIPSTDQVSNTIDASGCSWLKAVTAAGPTMDAASASAFAPLLARPLTAAEYAVNGMSGVARLYGC